MFEVKLLEIMGGKGGSQPEFRVGVSTEGSSLFLGDSEEKSIAGTGWES